MNEYSFNKDKKYHSLKEIVDSDEWKNDTNEYAFSRNLTGEYGMDGVIFTGESTEQLVEEVEKRVGLPLKVNKHSMLEDSRGRWYGHIGTKKNMYLPIHLR